VARGVRDALLGRPGGAGRAGAIVAGLAVTVGGYALGSLRARRGGARFAVAEAIAGGTAAEEPHGGHGPNGPAAGPPAEEATA
ncbi:glycosyltransferase family 2 protein, partial [Streptomyces sp. NPDC020667]